MMPGIIYYKRDESSKKKFYTKKFPSKPMSELELISI